MLIEESVGLREEVIGSQSDAFQYIWLEGGATTVWINTAYAFYYPGRRVYIGGLRLC